MKELLHSNFYDVDFKIAEIDGEPWFDEADVLYVLGFLSGDDVNIDAALSLVPEKFKQYALVDYGGELTLKIGFISRWGAYGLARKSKSILSDKFKRWLVEYELPENAEKTINFTRRN